MISYFQYHASRFIVRLAMRLPDEGAACLSLTKGYLPVIACQEQENLLNTKPSTQAEQFTVVKYKGVERKTDAQHWEGPIAVQSIKICTNILPHRVF
ncbi:MAG: hypothetical protein I3J02_05995 [Prevotella sp.]|nr:hypothetical protein [Prevotella sp.]